MKKALIPVIIAAVLLWISIDAGLWNKFFETAVAWFPFWHWGG